ncbi:MAG TPA: hypothetical protein PK511_02660 [Chitinophagales bacterium]|nr:hypothetical protein [Chitinophagales bacterium]HMX04058.1 hypothetical protein [Chitinophagales bacterium]HMZ89226.1 hypothetical protein [Chitinophagales bacterium]HNE45132.1 hypothetical protein [Chitinophagales bacterium]HNF69891.1 hypothetical protein [Chitinophagales bacterium]
MHIRKFFATMLFVASGMMLHAQTTNTIPNNLDKPDIIKFNLSGAVFGNYTLQYEHVLNVKQSVGMSISFAPNMDLPFKNALVNIFEGNDQAITAINSTQLNTFSITPEYRFYSEVKGAPFGVYGASFIRYTHMTHRQIYTFNLSDGEHHPDVETTFNGVGVGEMVGVQWKIGNSMTLDWWILGPFIGYQTGKSHGDDDRPITPEDKIKLENDIESVPIPGWNIDATVTDNGTTGLGVVDADLSGLFLGARVFGICLGYRF